MARSVRVLNGKVEKAGSAGQEHWQPGAVQRRFVVLHLSQALGAAPLVVARAASLVVAGSFSGRRHGVDSLAASIGVRRGWWPPNQRRYFRPPVQAHNKSFKHAPSGLDALPRAA